MERQTRFDRYRNNPEAAAAFIARDGYCDRCPMYEVCDDAPYHEKLDNCFRMWINFFKENPETLGSVNEFSKVLGNMIVCDKCPVAKENECDFKVMRSCEGCFYKWLCKECSTCQENRQVEESDNVNHPDHYMLVDGVEVIDVINEILTRSNFTGFQGYCLGNVIKYVLRADLKNGKEDYEKAFVYLEWLIQSMEEQENDRRNG